MAYRGYRYSLSALSVVITFPKSVQDLLGTNTPVRFGGQGSMIGNVSMARKNERFSAEGDATGGYAINETLDKTGTCTISIKQFAPLVSTLTTLFRKYDDDLNDAENINSYIPLEGGEVFGSCSIELYYAGNLVASAQGCFLNMPELPFEEENGSRDFTFECGAVDFEVLDSTQSKYLRDSGAVTLI